MTFEREARDWLGVMAPTRGRVPGLGKLGPQNRLTALPGSFEGSLRPNLKTTLKSHFLAEILATAKIVF